MMNNSAQNDAREARDEWSRASDTDRIQIAQLLAYALVIAMMLALMRLARGRTSAPGQPVRSSP